MTKMKGILAFFASVLLLYGLFTCAAVGGILPVSAEEALGSEISTPESANSSTPSESSESSAAPSSETPSEPDPTSTPEPGSSSTPESTPEPTPTPIPDSTPTPIPESTPEPVPEWTPEPSNTDPESSATDPIYSEDPASYEGGTTSYYDPTAEESITMIYPSGVTPSSSSSSSSSSEGSSSSESVAGTAANTASSTPPSSSNHTGRNLVLIGVVLLILSAAGIGYFIYSMFILPYLRKKRARQEPRPAYAGAAASAALSSDWQAAPEEEVFYEDAYGNRYRMEELPGLTDADAHDADSYGPLPASQPYPPYLEDSGQYPDGPSASATLYAENPERMPVSYYDADPYDSSYSQDSIYRGDTAPSPAPAADDREIYSGRDLQSSADRYEEQSRQYDPRQQRRYDRDWDRYFQDPDRKF